jgi:transcriptional regulator with XRE-family HTH domain
MKSGTIGDNRRNRNINSALLRHNLYRGIYSRVAQQLGVDRSYVSRVANGTRRSTEIEAALLKEIARIDKLTRRSK